MQLASNWQTWSAITSFLTDVQDEVLGVIRANDIFIQFEWYTVDKCHAPSMRLGA
jgi:hypothetical protein